ncbi:MAG: lipid-A-disaccharide synthase [Nitrospirae bacterium]|nr:lipid-A-disaccharide synthase [Candidatus Troglogloeales bacterium]
MNFPPFRIMIIAGEASGDLHGGALSTALFQTDPTLKIVGIGGQAMRKSGVDVQFDSARLGIVGLFEALLKWRDIWEGYQVAKSILQSGVHLLVIIDFPDFNLRMAKMAKALDIPVVYYIGPQLWAWRKGRIKTIAERVDKMLVIFPFEEAIYREAGVPCEFVGHPLIEEAVSFLETPFLKAEYLQKKRLDPSAITLGLLPGSRKTEIEAHLPVMLEGIKLLSKEVGPLQMLIPVASTLSADFISRFTQSYSLPIRIVEGDIYSVLRAADVVVAASGTVTLQAALTQTPMVVIYKLSWITYALARWLIDLPSISLVNIVAQTALVPELIQENATPERICLEIKKLLDPAVRDKMKAGLGKTVSLLGEGNASRRAAEIIHQTLNNPPDKEEGTEGFWMHLNKPPQSPVSGGGNFT